MKAISLFLEMSLPIDPWELFEPHLYKDKIGDGLWHCDLRSVNGVKISKGEGETMEAAIEACYYKHQGKKPI